ncbi:MAG: ligase-associated DNA damage response exonuclease [Gemmataceae bacterium]
MNDLLQLTKSGLYCTAGGFFIDPWQPVDRAVLTHAHSDHCRSGSRQYLVSREGLPVFRTRLGVSSAIEGLAYGDQVILGGVKVSFHPAGHILGSAQVRVEHQGQVWVVSGDFKLEPDSTCTAFEPVRCDLFVTESTFGLPIYRWPPAAELTAELNAWWRGNQKQGKASLLMGYALGKAQRLLACLDPSIGPIYLHGAVHKLVEDYRSAGVRLPPTRPVVEAPSSTNWSQALILAPPSVHGSPWTRRFGAHSTAMASGWMQIRGTRRRKALDRGFVFSDHADWPGLLLAIRATQASRVWVTHGYVAVLVRYLRSQGFDAQAVETRYQGESLEEEAAEPEEAKE